MSEHEHDGSAWDTKRARFAKQSDPTGGEEHEHDGAAWDRKRGRFAPKGLKVHGKKLEQWARDILAQDLARIHSAISIGLTSGDENTDIAHRVLGSRRNNGVEGATEITRQMILRVGKGLLQKRKSRMSGTAPDVRRSKTEKTDEA